MYTSRHKVIMELVLSFTHAMTEAFPYLLALSPLIVGVVALVNSLLQKVVENPIVGPIVNTTLVVLETTKAVWKPVLSTVLTLVKPIVRVLVLIAKNAWLMALSLRDSFLSAVTWVKANGGDVTHVVGEFARSMYIIGKALGKGMYYLSKGLSLVIDSFEKSNAFFRGVLDNPSSFTWDTLQENAIPLLVSASFLALVVWCVVPAPPPRQEEDVKKTEKSGRMETRAARRRAFLSSTS